MKTKKQHIGNYSLDCIASVVREQNSLVWSKYHLTEGISKEGDLILTRITHLGSRAQMEIFNGKKIINLPIHPGHYIVGVLANRHSGTSEYGNIPSKGFQLKVGSPIDLLDEGGTIGYCVSVPKTLGTHPTKLQVIGRITDQNEHAVNLRDLALSWEKNLLSSAPMIFSCGTASEIGKTTTARHLLNEFYNQGVTALASAKLSGTGRKRDIWAMSLENKIFASDFPDVGLPTTYTNPKKFQRGIYTLLNHINREAHPNLIVGECGGDIIEGNIPTLFADPKIMKSVKAIIHSSTDVLSIIGSLKVYEEYGILNKIPIFLVYPYTRNFYAIKKRLRQLKIRLPIFDPLDQKEIKDTVHQLRKLIQ